MHGSSPLSASARCAGAVVAAVACAGPAARAGAAGWDAPGEQFQVNTYTTSNQYGPAVDASPGGGFVVVWASRGDALGETTGLSVIHRQFAADGLPSGEPARVSNATTGASGEAELTHAPDGSFLVVWSDNGADGPDPNIGIRARRFASDGKALGAEVQVNSYTPGNQVRPDVARLGDGSFVVSWESKGSSGTDQLAYSAQARRLSALGETLATDFQVNTYTTGGQSRVTPAPRADGSFVVVWQNRYLHLSTVDLRPMAVASDGGIEPLGPVVSVAGGLDLERADYLDVAPLGPEELVVVWSHAAPGPAGWTRVDGVRATGEGAIASFEVSAGAESQQLFPKVATRPDGRFVAVWRAGGFVDEPGDGSSSGIRARAFDSSGVQAAEEITVNAYTTGPQDVPSVTALVDGRIVVVWDSFGSVGDDSSGYSVQGRILALTPPLFEDGFESGGFQEWSDVVGEAPVRARERREG